MRKRNKSWQWLLLIVGISLFFASSLIARRGILYFGEEHIIELTYGLSDNYKLLFLAITFLGSAWILAFLLIILIIKERYDIGLRLVIAGVGSYFVSGIAKELVSRPRPSVFITEVLQREFLVWGYGFPSAHTALATALAIIIGAYLPRKYLFLVPLWIILVGLSRLYLGVHAPLDIFGGFGIGLVVALCVIIALPPNKRTSNRVAKKRKQG